MCTLELSRQLWPDLASRSLPDLARAFEIEHDNPHRAADDALATGGVLLKAIETAHEMGLTELGDLYRLPELMDDATGDDEGLASQAAES